MLNSSFDEQKLKQFLQAPKDYYFANQKPQTQNIIRFLKLLFSNDLQTRSLAYQIPTSQDNLNVFFLGHIKTADNNEIPILIIEHPHTVHKKIGLLKDVAKILTNIDFQHEKFGLTNAFVNNAIIMFIPRSDPLGQWRLSLVTSLKDDSKTYKRHSFILGPQAAIRTPLEQFEQLYELVQQGSLTIDKLQQIFEVEPLTKQFYKDLISWFYWAAENIKFPKGNSEKDQNKINQEALIRFITRILFVWFLKQKQLVPNELFDINYLKNILKFSIADPSKSTETIYYKAMLQNLFFATLSVEIEKRKINSQLKLTKADQTVQNETTNQYVYKYADLFTIPPKEIKKLFSKIPFLNGGLFEVLDNPDKNEYYDGFTENTQYQPIFPDYLFFETNEKEVQLKLRDNKKYKVTGLFKILNNYHFTVAENTPLDKDVALDPELLGNIFENLLAEQLDESKETARKATGSYYTPHDIVNFMVEESLKEYLKTHITGTSQEKLEEYLQNLFSQTQTQTNLKQDELLNNQVINLLSKIKIIDPAVGSGAFPMGILNKIVFLLQKLDPNNEKWKQEQIEKIDKLDLPDNVKQEQKQKLIETLNQKSADYFRKLYIIRDSIFGVDIQPIAIQIARLRFFLSLIIEEQPKLNDAKNNFGIEPLPNLYMNFVIANSLVPLEYTTSNKNPFTGVSVQGPLPNLDNHIDSVKKEWLKIRKKLFWTSQPDKRNELKVEERKARKALAKALEGNYPNDYEKITSWDPYNPHQSADWFDPLFMLGVEDGFDIVIANPPYVRQERIKGQKPIFEKIYKVFTSTADLYTYFVEQAYNLLKDNGLSVLITSNKWFRAKYGEKLREFLKNNTKILKIIDFAGYQVFAATVDTQIIIFQKTKPKAEHKIQVLNIKNDYTADTKLHEYFNKNAFLLNQDYLSKQIYILVPNKILNLKRKIEEIGTPLKEWDINIYRGVITGFNKAFIIDEETRQEILNNCNTDEERKRTEEIIKPILRGRDIKRYYYKWAGLYVILAKFGSYKYIPSLYPSIYKHLSQYREQLQERGQCKYGRSGIRNSKKDYPGQHHWLELDNNPKEHYLKEFEKEKIVWQRVTKAPRFALVPPNYYILDSMAFMTCRDNDTLRYLLSVLNSSLTHFYLELIGHKYGDDGYLLSNQYVERFYIPNIPSNQKKPFIELVDKILELTRQKDYEKRQDLQKKVEELSRKIDGLVYGVYGVGGEEIKVIEGVYDN